MITEARLQAEAFQWHWNNYPTQRGLFFRIKNEGTNRISGARDKATGIVAGVADSVFLVPNRKPVFIEFKLPEGKQSPKQHDWQLTVERAGYSYFICRDLENFKKLIKCLQD